MTATEEKGPAGTAKEWLTAREAAGLIGVGVTTFYKMINKGQIKPTRPVEGGRTVRFSRRALELLMERRTGVRAKR